MSLGFPKWGQLVGGQFGKMTKNCMKMTNLAFLGQNSGGHGGVQANFWGSGRDPPSPTPLGETLISCFNIIT